MKLRTICSLGLLLLVCSALFAQLRVLPPPNPSCDGLSNLIEWGSQFRFNACHTGYNSYEVILSPASVGNLVLDWQYTTGDQIISTPAVANGVVYVGSFDNNVYALNALTGAKLWSYATGGPVYSSPAVANGVVYVGSDDQNVYALNALTGAKLWSFATGNIVISSPAVANGVVYVSYYSTRVYALNAATGALLWSYPLSLEGSSPAVADGVVYVGASDSSVYAFHLPGQ